MKKRRNKYPFIGMIAISIVVFWCSKITLFAVQTAEQETQNMPPETQIAAEKPQETASEEESVTEAETELPTKQTALPETKREFTKVDMDYLDGALFIGDSRTSTLYEYAGWDQTVFFVEYGLTIWTVMDAPIVTSSHTGKKITVREALQESQYDKIYMMLGINELGRGTEDTFQEQYLRVVEEIRELQPNALIFLESIMHVTQGKDDEKTYINNDEINARNEKIQVLANGQDIFYIDENEVFDAEGSGKLNPEYTFDGVHLKAKYIPIWRDFLLEHGVLL